MKLPALYFISVGVLMIGQWAFFLSVGAVPELQSEPWRIGFHLADELITAVCLIVGGAALLRKKSWGKRFALFAAGMLAYTTIASPGYFAQLGQWPLVGMFAVLLTLDAACVATLLRSN